jgi:hypothetical protein
MELALTCRAILSCWLFKHFREKKNNKKKQQQKKNKNGSKVEKSPYNLGCSWPHEAKKQCHCC